jgi:hypothetical protein
MHNRITYDSFLRTYSKAVTRGDSSRYRKKSISCNNMVIKIFFDCCVCLETKPDMGGGREKGLQKVEYTKRIVLG